MEGFVSPKIVRPVGPVSVGHHIYSGPRQLRPLIMISVAGRQLGSHGLHACPELGQLMQGPPPVRSAQPPLDHPRVIDIPEPAGVDRGTDLAFDSDQTHGLKNPGDLPGHCARRPLAIQVRGGQPVTRCDGAVDDGRPPLVQQPVMQGAFCSRFVIRLARAFHEFHSSNRARAQSDRTILQTIRGSILPSACHLPIRPRFV